MNNEENNVNDTNTPLPSIKVDQPPADGEQANDESAPIEIPQVESYTLESIPDELRITNYQDDMTSDSDSLLSSLNRNDIVNNYNHISDTTVSDDEYATSIEKQLTSSKDISLYTQQPKTVPNYNVPPVGAPMPYQNQPMGNNGYPAMTPMNNQNAYPTNQPRPPYPSVNPQSVSQYPVNQPVAPVSQPISQPAPQYPSQPVASAPQPVSQPTPKPMPQAYNNVDYSEIYASTPNNTPTMTPTPVAGPVENNVNTNSGHTNSFFDSSYTNDPFVNRVQNTYNGDMYSSNPYVTGNYSNPYDNEKKSTFIPKSEFASRPEDRGKETNFDKKMRKETRPYRYILIILYLIIAAVIGFVAYTLYLNSKDFYVSKSDLNIASGSSYEEGVFVKGAVDKVSNYEWKSNDPNIATVDQNGVIQAKNIGTTKIEVKSKKNKRTKEINVVVIDLVITEIRVNPEERVLYMGNTFTIEPIINGQNDITLDLNWESKDPNIATVDKNGLVTPVKAGHTQIVVSVPNTEFKATVDLTVASG